MNLNISLFLSFIENYKSFAQENFSFTHGFTVPTVSFIFFTFVHVPSLSVDDAKVIFILIITLQKNVTPQKREQTPLNFNAFFPLSFS